jgi:hypothetical protein
MEAQAQIRRSAGVSDALSYSIDHCAGAGEIVIQRFRHTARKPLP